jgi:transcriptional regulator with GAF, ATPase, and Fis domain
MPYLTFLSGTRRGEVVALVNAPLRLGRDSHIELPLDDPKTSRIHAEICFGREFSSWCVRDLHSKNGTFVNGQLLEAPRLLCEGDRITVGGTQLAYAAGAPPADGSRPGLDSVGAPLLPIGVQPALGDGGLSAPMRRREKLASAAHSEGVAESAAADDGEYESFETLELHAPLRLLSSGDDSGEASACTAVAADAAAALLRANEALRVLFETARAVSEAETSGEILNTLSVRLKTALSADRVWALPVDADGRWQMPASVADSSAEREVAAVKMIKRMPVSKTIVDYALRTKRAVLTSPGADERFADARSVGDQGITSALCVPIAHGGTVFALFYADRLGGRSFDRLDHELSAAACLQAGPVLVGLRRMEAVADSRERLIEEMRAQFNLLGDSAQIKGALSFVERAAPTDAAVLILGESGTGKELAARAVHYNSRRREASFVAVNCAALSETLIESELFGHVKGAFTGAAAERQGRFELADGGTIFLDEIGELSSGCQTKLLRVLEEGQLSRVGESKVRKVNVRVIAATNRDLAVEMEAGRFRKDLFYRLNVLSISLPPLRERGNDVKLLLDHFLKAAALQCGRSELRLSEEAASLLHAYPWPGNVREVRNLCERLAILAPNDIVGVLDLPPEYRVGVRPQIQSSATIPATGAGPADSSAGEVAPLNPTTSSLAAVEKAHIVRVLNDCGGNKKMAAEKLGIDRSTLYAKLRAYGI